MARSCSTTPTSRNTSSISTGSWSPCAPFSHARWRRCAPSSTVAYVVGSDAMTRGNADGCNTGEMSERHTAVSPDSAWSTVIAAARTSALCHLASSS